MADVTGPIPTLPGTHHVLPKGMVCDDCGAPATVRIQGETDSFGAELNDLCEACYQLSKKALTKEEDFETSCEWCKSRLLHSKLVTTRDPDEGSCGRVYYICKSCKDKQTKRLMEELEDSDFSLYDDDPYGDED